MFTKPLTLLLILSITIPVLGWLLFKKKRQKILGIYTASGLLITIYFLCDLYLEVVQKGFILIVNPLFQTLGAQLKVDSLGIFLAFIYTFLGLITAIYSIKYMENDTRLTEYYTLLIGMIAGMVGIVFSGDFFTLFVFWELMSLTSYALVSFRKQKWESIEAGFKFLIMSSAGNALILLAMAFLYGFSGTLNFSTLALNLENVSPNGWLYLIITLIIVGFGIKTAIVPFHTWVPDAHSAAPSSISALLSGVMVQTGAYALLRVLLGVFGSIPLIWQPLLTIFAIFTMFGGNILALLQNDLKRLLAFSTIAHIGYILFGFATTSSNGLTASLLHIMNHAIMKGLLFLCSGAFIYQLKTRDINKLNGVWKIMPKTSIFFAIGTIALLGIPPLNGFWSKLMIVQAGIEADMFLFSTLMLVNIAFSFVYFLRIIQSFFLKEPLSLPKKAKEVPLSMLICLLTLAVLCIIIGVYPDPFIALASQAQAALGI
jgi:proton-translocating NADH-quinone oxidoreductase chain N